MKEIILGGGCFWCIEALFNRLKGVLSTEVGYAGEQEFSNYESVCGGDGNIEVVKIAYDENTLPLTSLLEFFLLSHDATSKDKQGADIGKQYRSVIFYTALNDEKNIKDFLKKAQKNYQNPIVTEILPLKFYTRAEEYHQNYFDKNPHQAYCQAVIATKIQKIFKKH